MRRVSFVQDKKRNISRTLSKSLDVLEWLSIWEDSDVYFDGDRNYGYGGYQYDGRWSEVVRVIYDFYKLNKNSSLLDVGCAKGFLVHDYNNSHLVGDAAGIDISLYALIQGKRTGMKGDFFCGNATCLPFNKGEFDLIFCKDTLHNILSKDELITAIREIERVGKSSWIIVAAYNTNSQKKIIDKWATFATSYFSVTEWHEIFKDAGYSGDYDWFHPTEIIEDEQ